MINVNIIVNVTGFDGEFSYLFYDANNTNNIVITSPTGTGTLSSSTDTVQISTDVQFPDSSVIDQVDLRCKVTPTDGCGSNEIVLTVVNPCQNTLDITTTGPFTFALNYSGDVNTLSSISWSTSSSQLQPITPTNEAIVAYRIADFTSNDYSIPVTVDISATIQDTNGCEYTSTLTYAVCSPLARNGATKLQCDSSSQYKSKRLDFDYTELVKPCAGTTLDTSKTIAYSTDPFITVEVNGNYLNIYDTLGDQRTSLVYYKVFDNYNAPSNVATITCSVPTCLQDDNPNTPTTSPDLTSTDVLTGVVQDGVATVTPDTTVGDVITIDATEQVYSPNPIQWSSFSLVTAPTYGSVVLNQDAQLEYTVSDLTTSPSTPDFFSWQVSDSENNLYQVNNIVIRTAPAKPVLSTQTLCGTCGGTIENVDLLSGATGDINPNSIYFTHIDSDLTLTKNDDNTYNISIGESALFNNIVSFNVLNTQGYPADSDGTLAIISACAGQPTQDVVDITCFTSKIFDLKDYLTNVNGLTLTWTETTTTSPTYTDQGGTITDPDGTVDFTSIAPGTYTFQLTATSPTPCDTTSDTAEVTVLLKDTPSLSENSITDLGNGIVQLVFDYVNIVEPTFNLVIDGLDPEYISSPQFSGASVSMVVRLAPASSFSYVATAVDICASTITVSGTITTT